MFYYQENMVFSTLHQTLPAAINTMVDTFMWSEWAVLIRCIRSVPSLVPTGDIPTSKPISKSLLSISNNYSICHMLLGVAVIEKSNS